MSMNSIQTAKQLAGQAAANIIENGMVVGLGTGSTANYFIEALGKRCQEGLKIEAIASSEKSKLIAESQKIPLIDSSRIKFLDITVDGADEIDPQKNMIKGGGGALLREKILATSSRELIIIVDESKLVERLGRFPLPVEIAPFAYQTTISRLEKEGYQGLIRLNPDRTFYQTENSNYIFDIHLNHLITDPKIEDSHLKSITGVIETGLFYHLTGRVIIGYSNYSFKIQA